MEIENNKQEEQKQFTSEEANRFLNQIMPRDERKKKELANRQQMKMCQWFVFNMKCPNMIEFMNCTH